MQILSRLSVTLPLLLLLTIYSQCYLQFKLHRIPHQSKRLKQQPFTCPQSLTSISQQDYKQVCYEKDISYSFEIYREGNFYEISADLTTPISWVKGDQCKIKDSDEKCTLVDGGSIRGKIQEIKKEVKKKLKRHGDKKVSNDEEDDRKKAQIYGSSNVIQGYQQQPKHMSFEIMDSNRLTNLMDILLLGFYVLGQKDTLQLQSTKFINATSLTQKLNYISDGAISLRFDQNSQNSFLNQIFAYTKAQEKIATLYLGENSYLAIGQLSLKFSEHGYSGIQWVQIQQDENFGKVPLVSEMIVEDTERQIEKKITVGKHAILTLGASYLGLHSGLVEKFNLKLAKSAKCQFEEHGYLRCNYTKKSDKDKDLLKKLTFSFSQSSISLDLKDLTLHQQSKSVIFNIKQLFQQQFIILGQPVFKKYTLYLDYGKQRMGFALRRQHFQKQFINVVTLIRFLVITFSLGCCCILCSAPMRVVWKWCFDRKSRVKAVKGDRMGLRLKQYEPIDENPYDEISERIKSITTNKDTTQVDGHPDDSI